jgi:hypothetical protein
MKRLSLVCILFLLAAACAKESPKLAPYIEKPPEKVKDIGTTISFNPRVDILFVIDDSGSMEAKQKNLAKNIELFTNNLASMALLDYHIGVITTTMGAWSGGKGGDGKLVGNPLYIERSTPMGIPALKRNLLVGTNGSGQEKMFEPLYAALTPPVLDNENLGFYRPDAHLAVIIITDTDDQSDSQDADSAYRFLLDLKKNDKNKILTYGVYIPTTDATCDRSGEEHPYRLERFFTITGARTFGLCDVDYGQKLAGIGDDLVQRVGKTLYLSRPPVLKTIVVRFGTIHLPNDPQKGWVYDPRRNALLFGSEIDWGAQPPGTQIQVDFDAAEY